MALGALGFPNDTVSDGTQERALGSVMAQHTQRNASFVSQIVMKSPTWSGPICAVSFASERQECKPLWKAENSPVAFGCHTEVSYRQTISLPPPTLLGGTLASSKDAKKPQPNHSPSPHKYR